MSEIDLTEDNHSEISSNDELSLGSSNDTFYDEGIMNA